MKFIRKSIIAMALFIGIFGIGEPLLNDFGISGVARPAMAQNQDVETAGNNIRTSVIQVALIIYNRLRWPISFLGIVGCIGMAMWKRREGLGLIMTMGMFTFLWAFAPVVAKFFMGLAGVSESTTYTIQ